jgi:cell volume regulation protein A
MLELASYVTASGLLMIASILLGRTTNRIGVPALLAFLALGMIAGEQGIGRFAFSDFRLTFNLGMLALLVILFDGGLNTPAKRVRETILPAAVLATIGVFVTAVLTAIGARVFGFPTRQSFLIGAILSSTDAAAVFLIIRSAGVQLKRRPGAILELESGLNDPMAFLMTVTLTQSLVEDRAITARAAVGVAASLIIGGCGGAAVGWLGRTMLRKLRPGAGGLYPVFTLAVAFLSFGLPTLIDGSGLLAAYVSGIVMGAGRIPHSGSIRRVHDSIAWLAQLSMFLLLGLLVTPTELAKAALPGVAVALVLTFLARPIAVLICLLPFRYPPRELTYIAVIGLRGAVPIILAILPIMSNASGAHQVFNIVFFSVIVNALMPGVIVGRLTKWLRVATNEPPAPPAILEIMSGEVLEGGEIVSFHVEAVSAVAGSSISDLPLPPTCAVVLLIRGRKIIAPTSTAKIASGDHIYLLCPPDSLPFVSLIFGRQESD